VNLGLRQRPQTDGFNPPGERILDALGRQDVGRAGEQEPPRSPVAIHVLLDGQQQVRGALDLVQQHRTAEPTDEPSGISQSRRTYGVIVEAE
jgi:hypothetical protein